MQLLCPEVEARILSAFCNEASSLHLHPSTLEGHFYAKGKRDHLLETAMAGLEGIEMEVELTQARGMKPG